MKTKVRDQKFSSEQTLIQIFDKIFGGEKNLYIVPGNMIVRLNGKQARLFC